MRWESVTKVARSASIPGQRRSLNKDRLGAITVFYSMQDGESVRCIIDWGLFGILAIRETYNDFHYFISEHAVEGCELESYPNAWPKS